MSTYVTGQLSRCTPEATRGRLPLVSGLEWQSTPYLDDVRESEEIDRDKWSELLERLLREGKLTPETAARPVGPVPAAARTIRKWISGESGVGATKVRDVARSLGYSPSRALIEVGFLDTTEFGITGLTAASPLTDPTLIQIQRSLAHEATPEQTRTILRRSVRAAYDSWLAMQGIGGHEPAASRRVRRTPDPQQQR